MEDGLCPADAHGPDFHTHRGFTASMALAVDWKYGEFCFCHSLCGHWEQTPLECLHGDLISPDRNQRVVVVELGLPVRIKNDLNQQI